ncbi:hypothetical protein B9Z55_000353 [Caenorhabditis nigoni]|uniref:Uncharacterized protein n=1 Tax=Caenorhabditis nigoni TaxID=1611254 RepID=A0A2G5VR63_9PELO|nr:hypothetical protein B9Z55_000353 [Caenorhabditis nigoni]
MSDFVPETEENEEEPIEMKPEPKKPVEAVVVDQNFLRRFLNNKWYGKYGEDGALLEHLSNDWVPVAEDEQEFLSQLWFEQEEQEKNAHKHYDCDEEKKEWVPKPTTSEEVNEDFIAEYKANYGVQYDDIYNRTCEKLPELADRFLMPGDSDHVEQHLLTNTQLENDRYSLQKVREHCISRIRCSSQDLTNIRKSPVFCEYSDFTKARILEKIIDKMKWGKFKRECLDHHHSMIRRSNCIEFR